MADDFGSNLLLEFIKTLFSLLLLVVGWLGGQNIIAYWDDRKKRNEMDIAAAQRFFDLYGEFKAITRLWSIFTFHAKAGREGRERIQFPPDDDSLRLELLQRSADAESGVEALILKLTTERKLNSAQMETLGLFRQAYQRLRIAIRKDEEFPWFSHTGEYALFNELAAKVALMISFDEGPKLRLIGWRRGAGGRDEKVKNALRNLREVTGYSPGHFNRRARGTTPVRTKGEAAAARAESGAAKRI